MLDTNTNKEEKAFDTKSKNDEEEIIKTPVLKAFLAGSISGTFSTILFQPLDLVKTRLQNTASFTATNNVRGASVGMLDIFSHILRNEQLFGLWKGCAPSLTRTVPGVGLYFSSMHWMTQKFADGNPKPLEAIAIGISARTLSAASLIPITVVKTRYESGDFEYRSVRQALQTIYTKEGVKGLTCGLVPTIFRDAPFSGIYLMFYTQTKKMIPPELLKGEMQAPIQFSCGVMAGILASLVTQPADVVKTKMQLYPHLYPDIKSVLFHLHEKYGVKGYFKGLAPRMLRRTLMSAMAWTVYEQITRSIGLK